MIDHQAESVTAWQRLADRPGYILPCPACSFLDRQDHGPDLIHVPSIYHNRLMERGRLVFIACASACPVCCTFREATADEAETAAAWWKHVALIANAQVQKPIAVATQNHVRLTLQRLRARGRVPSEFPMPSSE